MSFCSTSNAVGWVQAIQVLYANLFLENGRVQIPQIELVPSYQTVSNANRLRDLLALYAARTAQIVEDRRAGGTGQACSLDDLEGRKRAFADRIQIGNGVNYENFDQIYRAVRTIVDRSSGEKHPVCVDMSGGTGIFSAAGASATIHRKTAHFCYERTKESSAPMVVMAYNAEASILSEGNSR